jgi:hypothetical protein
MQRPYGTLEGKCLNRINVLNTWFGFVHLGKMP